MRETITDHDEIRRWAEAHDAHPVEVIPYVFDGQPAVLRFVFGDVKEQPELRPVSWESFFATFELLGLTFVYGGDHRYELVQLPGRSPKAFVDRPA